MFKNLQTKSQLNYKGGYKHWKQKEKKEFYIYSSMNI